MPANVARSILSAINLLSIVSALRRWRSWAVVARRLASRWTVVILEWNQLVHLYYLIRARYDDITVLNLFDLKLTWTNCTPCKICTVGRHYSNVRCLITVSRLLIRFQSCWRRVCEQQCTCYCCQRVLSLMSFTDATKRLSLTKPRRRRPSVNWTPDGRKLAHDDCIWKIRKLTWPEFFSFVASALWILSSAVVT